MNTNKNQWFFFLIFHTVSVIILPDNNIGRGVREALVRDREIRE